MRRAPAEVCDIPSRCVSPNMAQLFIAITTSSFTERWNEAVRVSKRLHLHLMSGIPVEPFPLTPLVQAKQGNGVFFAPTHCEWYLPPQAIPLPEGCGLSSPRTHLLSEKELRLLSYDPVLLHISSSFPLGCLSPPSVTAAQACGVCVNYLWRCDYCCLSMEGDLWLLQFVAPAITTEWQEMLTSFDWSNVSEGQYSFVVDKVIKIREQCR